MIQVLAVCTGNICRSPMAEAFLRSGARAVGLDAEVASAGLVRSGAPADPHAVATMAERGIDISDHRSHRLADVDVAAADLVLCMASDHVLEVVGRVPAALPKTYTLREFVRLGLAAGPCPAGLDPVSWVPTLHAASRQTSLLRRNSTDDVADPIGQGRRAFERTADLLDELVWAAVDLLAGYAPRTSA